MVTSIRLLGASVGLALPAAAAIALYWVGGTHPGLLGLLFTVAVLGIPLGAVSGAVFAPRAIVSTRPFLVAAEATFVTVLIGFLAYALLVVGGLIGGAAGQDAPGARAGLDNVVASLVVVSVSVLAAWAYAMPYALLGVALVRRLHKAGVSRARLASIAVSLAIAAIVTGVDALGR